jgi:hypothetical protein
MRLDFTSPEATRAQLAAGDDMPLTDVLFVSSTKQAKRLLADVNRLGLNRPGGTYVYREIGGSSLTGTYMGFEGLNLKFRKADGTTFTAPVIDMSDGSLVTEYLFRVEP